MARMDGWSDFTRSIRGRGRRDLQRWLFLLVVVHELPFGTMDRGIDG